ncbi:MAG: hypothetical protein ACE5HF_10285 [Gemmatimonadota bacterium]
MSPETDPTDRAATEATECALAAAGAADPRPALRRLLVQLKARDPEAFEAASRRYQEELVPAVAGGEADPLASWIEYGMWLASRLSAGSAVAIDPTGVATPFAGGTPPAASLLLHVPEQANVRATVLLGPTDPSDPQRATAQLLAG